MTEVAFTRAALQVDVPDFRAAVDFYGGLFGSRPDLAPHQDFVEWCVALRLCGLYVVHTGVDYWNSAGK